MAPENQQENKGVKNRQFILPVSLGLLVAAGGVAAYQWNQPSVSVSAPADTKQEGKAQSQEKKPAPEIRLNTDDKQVRNIVRNPAKESASNEVAAEPKRRSEKQKEEVPSPLTNSDSLLAFSLKADTEGEIYDDTISLADAPDEEDPIADLVVDQDGIILPEPTLIPDDLSLFPSDGMVPETDGMTEENPTDEQEPTEGNENEEEWNDSGDGEDSQSGYNENPRPVFIPGSLYNSLYEYIAMNDSYNIVYYGKNVMANDPQYEEITKRIAESTARLQAEAEQDTALSYQSQANVQLLNSLTFAQPQILASQKAAQQSLFEKYVQSEVNLYTAASDERKPYRDAKHIVYFTGKYNEQANKPLAPEAYKDADKKLLEAAGRDAGSSSSAVEALNKYQIAEQYAPGVAAQAQEKEQEVLSKLAPTSDLLSQAQQATETDISRAVVLASEAVEKDNENAEARSTLRELSEKLLASAENFDLAAEEQAYEILSTRPAIDKHIADVATEHKKALAYAKKAEELVEAKNYSQALYYASESSRLYKKKDLNDKIIAQAASKLLDQAKKEELDAQLAMYRSITSAPGVPNEYVQQAKFLQEAINEYHKGMRQTNPEEAIRYLSSTWQHPSLQQFADDPLKEKSRALFDRANAMKDEKPGVAARYFETLLQTPGVEQDIQDRSKSALSEMKGKNTNVL